MRYKIEVGQIWFSKNYLNGKEHMIASVIPDAYARFENGIVLIYVDIDSCSSEIDIGRSWHFRWADHIICDCNLKRNLCLKHRTITVL